MKKEVAKEPDGYEQKMNMSRAGELFPWSSLLLFNNKGKLENVNDVDDERQGFSYDELFPTSLART